VKAQLANTSVSAVLYIPEFFQQNFLTFAAPLKGFSTPSAWPPTRDFALFPTAIWINWSDPKDDTTILQAIKASTDKLRAKAVALGQTNSAVKKTNSVKYPNYAAGFNSPADIYGTNLPILNKLAKKYDPNGVMTLAGGFKVQ
jgi:hypothetical protein